MAANEPQAPPGWILIAQDGALYRGPGRGNPLEVWSRAGEWKAYAGGPKSVEWGTEISAVEARRLISCGGTSQRSRAGRPLNDNRSR